jgi:ABC-type phosphate/phosphonate transport system ATPase subunit
MQLCPAQQQTFDQLMEVLPLFDILGLAGGSGSGRTTVLRRVHEAVGGAYLTMKEYLDALRPGHPLQMEEVLEQLVMGALQTHDCVLVDDLSAAVNVLMGRCGGYPRPGFVLAALQTLGEFAQAHRKKLIVSSDQPVWPLQQMGYVAHIPPFQPADYEFLNRVYLGPELSARLDYAKVFRFAAHLNAYHLKTVGALLRGRQELDTQAYIDFLRSFHLTSNVDLEEVQHVTLRDLKGADEVIRELETHVIVPLENDELSAELQLRPKRGVLLVGPPGTGKTTVGRALAHRLKSKFFLLDGTVVSGTGNFYSQVHWIFEQAKRNAPAVVFVDDSDAIFESGEELGLYRYLLTLLDGLESATAGRVCVMMTAMDVAHLPPALIRSGRIELWLEMHLPEKEARAEILTANLAPVAATLGKVDVPRLAGATEGFTGADLKRLIEDGKNLLAYDRAQGRPVRAATEYFLTAVAAVRANKAHYAEADARARQQRPRRPAYYDDQERMMS